MLLFDQKKRNATTELQYIAVDHRTAASQLNYPHKGVMLGRCCVAHGNIDAALPDSVVGPDK